jgi:hypothetical protein
VAKNDTVTTQADFGGPVFGSDAVSACIYDDTGTLLRQYTVDRARALYAERACWRATGTKGFCYSDKGASADGI